MTTPSKTPLINTLWVNKRTGRVARIHTEPQGAHRYVTMHNGARSYSVSADNLDNKYRPVDAEWIAHAPEGTTIPDLDGRVWTRDGLGQWYSDDTDEGRYSTDLQLWPAENES